MLRLACVVACLQGCQCVVAPDKDPIENLYSMPSRTTDYDFAYTDDPENQRIKLTFVSKSSREICVGRETWPDAVGEVTENGYNNGIYLIVGGDIFALRESPDVNRGFCNEKSCYNPLAKGQRLDAYIRYNNFSVPAVHQFSAKRLKYFPQPFWCDRGKFFGK